MAKTKTVINLFDNREDRNAALLAAILAHAETEKMGLKEVVEMLLGETLGNSLIDDELEENFIIGIAGTFGAATKNPQHDLNGGFEGNCDDDDDDGGDGDSDQKNGKVI